MGKPAAKQGDRVAGVDTHIVLVPSPGGPVPTPLPHPFLGVIQGGLSSDVKVMGRPAATKDSTAQNGPAHVPTPPGTSFQKPPSNKATILTGSTTVFINGKPAARIGDTAITCNDPADAPVGKVVSPVPSNVLIGG